MQPDVCKASVILREHRVSTIAVPAARLFGVGQVVGGGSTIKPPDWQDCLISADALSIRRDAGRWLVDLVGGESIRPANTPPPLFLPRSRHA